MTTAGPENDSDPLKDFLAPNDVLCPACRYNLRGNQSGSCPECGYSLRLQLVDDRLSAAPFAVGMIGLAGTCGFAFIGLGFFSLVWIGIIGEQGITPRLVTKYFLSFLISTSLLAAWCHWNHRLQRLRTCWRWLLAVACLVYSTCTIYVTNTL